MPPSQLRLRAIAGGNMGRGRSPPRPSTRSMALGVAPTASAATQEAMRSIQASIEARAQAADIDYRAEHGDPDATDEGSRKRARTELCVRRQGLQPLNATVDKRDGRTKIYIGGYEFTRASITRIKIVYRCSFYRSQECGSKLEFYASMMDYDFANMIPHTCTPPSHAHLPLDESTKTMVVRTAMQREVDNLAVTTADTPQVIWDAVSKQFYDRSDNVVVRGLSKVQVTKRVHRVRAEHFGSDIHGRVEVPPLSRVRSTPLNFFQFHHVWTNAKVKNEYKIDRVIGWAHPSLLSLLRYTKISLFIDGTFRCVPTHFRQCIVVMVFDQGSKLYVPVFYILAASKTYDAYWNVLQYVSDACGERLDPQQVVCDFEPALIGAVQDWFPDTDVVGCFFHFKQACSRKMAKLHISKAEIKVAMEQGVLDALTVAERSSIAVNGVAWVRATIKARCAEQSIKYSAQSWGKFWKYFARTWIKTLPPTVWNVHGIRRDIVARTNNPLERFNRELNSEFSTPHPSAVRFVQTIETISRRYVRLREDIARGVAAPPRRDTQPQLPSPIVFPEAAEDGELMEEEEEEDDGVERLSSGASDEEISESDQDGDGGRMIDADLGYEFYGDEEEQAASV